MNIEKLQSITLPFSGYHWEVAAAVGMQALNQGMQQMGGQDGFGTGVIQGALNSLNKSEEETDENLSEEEKKRRAEQKAAEEEKANKFDWRDGVGVLFGNQQASENVGNYLGNKVKSFLN